jgi:hypothetical protein
MLMKTGNTHTEIARHIFNLQRPVEFLAELLDRPRNAARVTFRSSSIPLIAIAAFLKLLNPSIG